MNLRRAVMGDGDRLLEWRNDPVSVRYSGSQRTVTPAEHERWLSVSLGHESQERVWIVEEPAQVPIGSVRLGFYVRGRAGAERFETEPCGHVSIVLDPMVRGRGWARAALDLLAEEAARLGLVFLSAEVRVDNVASLVTFFKAGFRPRWLYPEAVLLCRTIGDADALRGAAGVESSPLSPTLGGVA